MSARKYFGTDGIRGKVGEYPITPEFVMKLGWAIGKVLGSSNRDRIVIGKDTRISGYMFESALESGIIAAGMNVQILGPMPTPGIAYLTRTFRAAAGIVISASHNSYLDNGIKFFSPEGFKLPDEVELAIENQLDQPMTTVSADKLGKAKLVKTAAGRYIEFCKASVPTQLSLEGLKIVIDCANGAAYSIAPKVFRELGANVQTIFNQPDGLNINKECGATDLATLAKVVKANKADIGLAFDGDADRIMMVDHTGEIVDGDEILYIIAQDANKRDVLGGGVVGTLMSNFGLQKAFEADGIPFARAKVGDRYVMELLHKNSWRFGGESSGHIVCLDKNTTGDGIISALQVLAAMACENKSLAELKQGMFKMPQTMVNVKISEKCDPMQNDAIVKAVNEVEDDLGDTGRVLLRASGTEPLIRVMIEGEDAPKVDKLANQLADVVREKL
ncbi:phosphoglucosamine mutase [Aliikangiella coralliicola]|uniref:Phosphoglucosamine mutase n=1 Tax=Aliikangiella coralliicola TaxID=2592383 RepID=A0A545UHP4_9GAMM|nr:phosphoglucosamine mutase [Aliikangiella coralliicola]TQV88979.1 phosphoglucosamine mutase [Aliikangiella coralliicola]